MVKAIIVMGAIAIGFVISFGFGALCVGYLWTHADPLAREVMAILGATVAVIALILLGSHVYGRIES